ncbi:DUF1479-domain-containing protein [Xylariaceae sp. FL1651]|nr:DUF1479-domain-containing protein [Xylariaceae sp. FL1651]
MLLAEPTHHTITGQQHSGYPHEASSNMATDFMSTLESEPIPLSARFAKLKRNMIACREKAVAESFYRLLRELRAECDHIASSGPDDIIPTIDYFDIHDGGKAAAFRKALRKRGVAVIRRVIPPTVTQAWREETLDYLADNPHTRGYPPHDPQLFDLYWSPGQVRARADSRLLDAQRFAMGTWHASDEDAPVSTAHPVSYADRLRIHAPGLGNNAGSGSGSLAIGPHIDNGSVERWEPDGYGAGGTYAPIFQGAWEAYDPWDSSPRLHITTDLYNRAGSCSMFRMFQGWLSLSPIAAGGRRENNNNNSSSSSNDSNNGSFLVCPMLQLSTAYLLLRPFFTPRRDDPSAPDFLHPSNWNLNVSQTSILHGAVPGYVQELSGALHPHLQLQRTMVSIPAVEPGDYVLWHPDVIHAIDTVHAASPSSSGSDLGSNSAALYSSPPSFRLCSSSNSNSNCTSTPGATVLYISACPLTQTNALYLSRQRRAFLLGLPAPDFFESAGSAGERDHSGRPGVQDVADAGGEEGLRSMGLTPWEDDGRGGGFGISGRERDKDRELLRLANGILFPDRFDGVLKRGGVR